jgi:hypothetical protein
MKCTNKLSGVTVGAPTYTPVCGGTMGTMLGVPICRSHRLFETPPSLWAKTTNFPSGEMAGATALPLVVSCVIV